MNSWTGIGNLGANPELRSTPSGRSVTNFAIAVDRRYYSGQGEDRELIRETDWINVVVWNGLAEVCSRYLQKGSKVCIEGPIRSRAFTDRNGVKHNTFEVNAEKVHFLDRIRSTAEATDTTQELDTDVAESDYPTPQTVNSESFSTTS